MKLRSRSNWRPLLLAAGLAGVSLTAQEPAKPGPPPSSQPAPPPPPPNFDRDGDPDHRRERHFEWRGRGHDGDHRGPPGSKSMGGRPPMWGEGFDKLSDDQKRRVREALGKAWGRPAVSAAREKLMAANDEMRHAIQEALLEIDPEIAKILQNMRGPDGFGGRGEPPPRLPPVEAPEFPDAVVERLENELLVFSPPERREMVPDVHARLLLMPAIKTAIDHLRAVPVADRPQAMEDLRKVYREAVSQEWRRLREGAEKSDSRSPAPQTGEKPAEPASPKSVPSPP